MTHTLVPGPERIECEVGARDASPTFAHAAIASPLHAASLVGMGEAEGWTSRVCDRGPFECVEVWLENRLLVELLDPAMLADYRAGMTTANWKRMFGLED